MGKLITTIICAILLANIPLNAQNGWAEENLKSNVSILKKRCYEPLITAKGLEKETVINCLEGNNDYLFDQKGKKIEVLGFDEKNKLDWKLTYNYQPNENKVELIFKDPSHNVLSKTIHVYNGLGSLKEEHHFDSQGLLLEKIEHEYNLLNKNRIATTCYKPDGGLRWKEIYDFDKEGNITKYKHYNLQNKLGWETIYKYDNLNNKIEEKTLDEDGTELSYYIYEYVYDNHDNWINQVTFSIINATKIPENIIEREIIYY